MGLDDEWKKHTEVKATDGVELSNLAGKRKEQLQALGLIDEDATDEYLRMRTEWARVS